MIYFYKRFQINRTLPGPIVGLPKFLVTRATRQTQLGRDQTAFPSMADPDPSGGGGGVPTDGGGTRDENSEENNIHPCKVIITDVVLAFMHSWFQGNNQQEIVKLALSSFTPAQLTEAARNITEKFPETGKFVAHRDTAGRSASEMYAADILKVFQNIDSKGLQVVFSCDSISMRTVKVSTMLFSDEEPIIGHKLALMENTISELLADQKTLFALLEKKLQPANLQTGPTVPAASSAPSASVSSTPTGPAPATGQALTLNLCRNCCKACYQEE